MVIPISGSRGDFWRYVGCNRDGEMISDSVPCNAEGKFICISKGKNNYTGIFICQARGPRYPFIVKNEKKTKYTRTRKSTFYFFGKIYFWRAFRKPFLNGQREKTEGCEREKESKG